MGGRFLVRAAVWVGIFAADIDEHAAAEIGRFCPIGDKVKIGASGLRFGFFIQCRSKFVHELFMAVVQNGIYQAVFTAEMGI